MGWRAMDKFAQVQFSRDQFADHALLRFNVLVGVHDREPELGTHGQVLLEDPALENPKALVRVRRNAQIHARLKIFQCGAALQDSLQGNLQIRLKEKGDVRKRGEIVNSADPLRGAAPRGVPREGRKYIAIAEDDITGAKQRNELPFVAICEISGVDQAESGGGEQFAFFALAGGGLDQIRGVPFTEKNLQALHLQPASQQV